MNVSISTDTPERCTVRVQGEVDAYTAVDLEKALAGPLESKATRFVVDLSRVTYLSSAGLRVLLHVHQVLEKRGGQARLFGLVPPVRKVFEMAGFDRVLRIVGSSEEAAGD
ncbi:MAG: STAS domain-containing protein [Candidatus Riflebacteria bacterium]|nr:STAS domain-containing protein [Candidatus Riflebacteria bacterium]